MKELPASAVAYKRTADFTRTTVPSGLLRGHRTKDGAWGKIVVLEGELTYRILEPTREEVVLTPGCPGVIEPTIEHEVEPRGDVRFYVEFYRVDGAR